MIAMMPRKRRRKSARQQATVSAPGPTGPTPRAATPPRRASVIEAANLGIRFALEMGALLVLGIAGFEATESPLRWLLAIGAPGLAATIWGVFVSPRATMRLPDPQRVAVEVVFFAAAVVALISLDSVPSAMLYAALAALNLTMMFRLNQRGL